MGGFLVSLSMGKAFILDYLCGHLSGSAQLNMNIMCKL